MYDDENTASAGMAFDVGSFLDRGSAGNRHPVCRRRKMRKFRHRRMPSSESAMRGCPPFIPAKSGTYGETTMTALHLTYTLGPGVLIGGQIAAGTSEGSDDGTQFMLGTAVFFLIDHRQSVTKGSTQVLPFFVVEYDGVSRGQKLLSPIMWDSA